MREWSLIGWTSSPPTGPRKKERTKESRSWREANVRNGGITKGNAKLALATACQLFLSLHCHTLPEWATRSPDRRIQMRSYFWRSQSCLWRSIWPPYLNHHIELIIQMRNLRRLHSSGCFHPVDAFVDYFISSQFITRKVLYHIWSFSHLLSRTSRWLLAFWPEIG